MTEGETSVAAAPASETGWFASMFYGTITIAIVMIMLVGITTVVVAWEESKVEFVGDYHLRIHRSTWWGFFPDVQTYRAETGGWVREVSPGVEEKVSARPVILDY